VVVALPEIKSFKFNERDHDFILLGSDGVFDKLSTSEIAKALWEPNPYSKGSVHEEVGH